MLDIGSKGAIIIILSTTSPTLDIISFFLGKEKNLRYLLCTEFV